MNALTARLSDRIREQGPISVADYMAEALGHPDHGYYMTREPFGAGGDFITAPEISQMFGELIGLWCAVAWRAMGEPSPFRLVELGPGRGALMADALRACRVAPGFLKAAHVHLVETSPRLAALQRNAVAATWHERFADVPGGPLILIANEFFDALPIHQLVRSRDGWRERRIGLTPDGALAFVVSPLLDEPPPGLPPAAEGAVVETCPDGSALMTAIAARIVAEGGAALIVDYGHAESGAGETLQAVRAHRYHSVLDDPGEADLTAHVDFSALTEAARKAGARVHGPIPQGRFLAALGIEQRAAALAAKASPEQAVRIRTELLRLTDPAAMGRLFKAFAVTAPDMPIPAGFEGMAA